MRKRVYYEAIDGTQFDTVQACENYENNLQWPARNIIFLDEELERMPVTEANMFDAEVVIVNSSDVMEWFDNRAIEKNNIDTVGIWVREPEREDPNDLTFYDLRHSVEELRRGYELEKQYLDAVLKATTDFEFEC